MPAPVLLIEYDADLVPESGAEVVSSVAEFLKAEGKDAAGHCFHNYALLQSGLLEWSNSSDSSSADNDDSADVESSTTNNNEPSASEMMKKLQNDEPPEGMQWKKAKKKKREVKKTSEDDLYALLGLKHERWMATEQQITKAYRKVALQFHPDKVACADEETKIKVEDKFKTIQEAYDILSNPTTRREFDSTDDFDDTLPSNCASKDFFSVFGPAFRRNARWSVIKPVPDIGDDNLSWDEVNSFYDFWYSFKSWREFPHPEEEDPASAECREHRRWIERQNSKLREKGKKEEAKRLREFVDNAYRIDPRVIRRKEEQKMARQRKKQEKAEARQKAEAEERAKKEKEEAEQKAKEEMARQAALEAKKRKDEEKKAMREARKRLREICTSEERGCFLDDHDTSTLCQKLDFDKLVKLADFLDENKGKPERCKKALQSTLDELDKAEQEEIQRRKDVLAATEQAMKDAKRKEQEKKKKWMSEWSEEELKMLDKALKKFPQGTRKRWEQVTACIGTRSQDEVLMMVKERKGASVKRWEGQENWKAAQKKQANIHSDPTQATESFTDVQLNRNADEGGSGAKKVVSTETGEWTEEQELALVKALKMYGRDVDERWEKISAVVPGKTKAQCFKRFKELRETFRAKKSG